MSLKPQPPRPMPPDIAAWGAKHLPADSPYKLIGDTLYAQFRDEDFADLYPRDGQPSLSPVLLAFVTAFQALENLPDRAAANAVRTRLDWKYALHLPLDDDGFDYSVVCEFRARLLKHDAEARLFERILIHLKATGLLKSRGIQRTDSLALLTKARSLGRLELMIESLRVALRALLKAALDWTQATMPKEWDERYAVCCRAERLSDEERQKMASEVGDDGQWLLDRLQQDDAADLRVLPAVEILRTVWSQHYQQVDGHTQWLPAAGYEGATRIQTPYDPEARWSEKHGKGWLGDKLQVTETDAADAPHLITDIVVTGSVETDHTAFPQMVERQKQRDVLPGERYVDRGYASGANFALSADHEETLMAYAPGRSTPQSRMGGLTHEDFHIDLIAETVTCRGGISTPLRPRKGGTAVAEFPNEACALCRLKPICCTGKDGRRVTIGPDYPALAHARQRQKTETFKRQYNAHRGGVEACLSALVRGQGIRVNRYIGRKKNNLRALFIGVAANLARTAAWLAGERPRKRKLRLGLAASGG